MRQIKLFIICLTLTMAVSSCCVNCRQQPKEAEPVYAPENPPGPSPSGQIMN